MRKSLLILALGLFMSASVANACDGDKTACKAHKGKKATTASVTKGTKSDKCDMKAMKDGKCDMKAMKGDAKHDCCKAKAEAAPKS